MSAVNERGNRGLRRAESGDLKGALEDLRFVLGVMERDGNEDAVAMALTNIGAVQQDQGAWKEAESTLRKSLKLLQKRGSQEQFVYTVALQNLGFSLLMQEQSEEALVLFRKVEKLRRKSVGKASAPYAKTLLFAGAALEKLKRFEEALPKFEEALKIRSKLFGRSHVLTAAVLVRIASCRFQLSSKEEEEHSKLVEYLAVLAEARKSFENAQVRDLEYFRMLMLEASVLLTMGRVSEARAKALYCKSEQEKAGATQSSTYRQTVEFLEQIQQIQPMEDQTESTWGKITDLMWGLIGLAIFFMTGNDAPDAQIPRGWAADFKALKCSNEIEEHLALRIVSRLGILAFCVLFLGWTFFASGRSWWTPWICGGGIWLLHILISASYVAQEKSTREGAETR
jgi:tetratricopeptide (TPR) repeat protein